MNFATMGRVSQSVKQIWNAQNAKTQTVGADHSINPYEDYSMCLTGKEHLKTLVPISDDIKNEIISRVHEDFRLRGGMTPDKDRLSETKKAYIMSAPPDKRISVAWTLDQTQIAEAHRIADFIKSKDPTWTNGKPVKPEILEEALRPKLDKKI